jgi:hypothetical protein
VRVVGELIAGVLQGEACKHARFRIQAGEPFYVVGQCAAVLSDADSVLCAVPCCVVPCPPLPLQMTTMMDLLEDYLGFRRHRWGGVKGSS